MSSGWYRAISRTFMGYNNARYCFALAVDDANAVINGNIRNRIELHFSDDGWLIWKRIRHHNAGRSDRNGMQINIRTNGEPLYWRTDVEYRTVASGRRSQDRRRAATPVIGERTIRTGTGARYSVVSPFRQRADRTRIFFWAMRNSWRELLAYRRSDADKAFVVTNEGKCFPDAVGNTHILSGASQDPDKANHAGEGTK